MISKSIILIALVGAVIADGILPVYHHAPQPYKFGYDIKDHHGEQYRHEEGVGGQAVKGSYGFTDARGVKRQVDYVADHGGFRAQVRTNEPGTANQNPAAVHMVSDAPYAGGMGLGGLRYGGLGNMGLGNVGLRYGGLGNVVDGNMGLGLQNGFAGGMAGRGMGNGMYRNGLGLGLLGGLGYSRYGY